MQTASLIDIPLAVEPVEDAPVSRELQQLWFAVAGERWSSLLIVPAPGAAAGDVAEGRDLVTGTPDVHAIEPTAMEHGRVVGANMAGRPLAYRGSLLMNIVEVCHLDVASFGRWDDPEAEVVTALRPERPAYRKLLFHDDRLTGAMILGPAAGS